MKVATLAFLLAAMAAGADDFAGFYDSVQSVALRAEAVATIPNLPKVTCNVEYKASGELYLYSVDCTGAENVTAETRAYDGDRTRMYQKVANVVHSTLGNVKGTGTAFGVPNPFYVPVAAYLRSTENWQLRDVKDALAASKVQTDDINVRMDDMRDGFPRHIVLTSKADKAARVEYRITELEINQTIPLDAFTPKPAGTTEVKAEDIEAKMPPAKAKPQPDDHN